MMRKFLSFLIVMIAMFMVASAVGAKGHSHSHSHSEKEDKFHDPEKVEWAIKKIRKATEKYQNVEKALQDGYEPASPYVPQMGYHYVKGELVDGIADPLAPEALLYIPTKKGLKLVAVEYLSVTDNSLFGVAFDPPQGPIPYSLHAWIYTSNPKGIFTPFNPRIPTEE